MLSQKEHVPKLEDWDDEVFFSIELNVSDHHIRMLFCTLINYQKGSVVIFFNHFGSSNTYFHLNILFGLLLNYNVAIYQNKLSFDYNCIFKLQEI